MPNTTRQRAGRIACIVLGAGIFILFTPFVSFVFNSGSVIGMLTGLCLLLGGLFPARVRTIRERCRKTAAGRVILRVFSVILIVFSVYALVVTALVSRECFVSSVDIPENTPAVVLGCKVNGDKPSRMLQKRIETAYTYLTENPQAIAVLSGGKGDDEDLSEAQAMCNALTEMGISSDRLFLEDGSETTAENLHFSKEILHEQGFDGAVAVITTDFHQFRTGLLAKKADLTVYPVRARSGMFSLPTFIVREWFTLFGVLFGK